MFPGDYNKLFQDIGERFKVFRELSGFSRKGIAVELGTSVSLIRQIEEGKGEAYHDLLFYFLVLLTRDFGLNCQWLLSGCGRAFFEKGMKRQGYDYRKKITLDS